MPTAANHAHSPASPPAPGAPVWLVFCAMACSVFAALFGRLAPHAAFASAASCPDSPDDGATPFAIFLHLIAIDWFRRFRSAPSTPAELLRRSPVAQALLNQPAAPVIPCDRPGERPLAGSFAPAFVSQLAAAPAAPLPLTPSSCLRAFIAPYAATRSGRRRTLPDGSAILDMAHSAIQVRRPGGPSKPQSEIRNPQSAIFPSAFRIQHSAFLYAPG